MVIVLVLGLYTSRIILEKLGVEDYGIYNVVAGFVTMLGFLNTSLSNGIQRFYNFELGKNGNLGANKVFNIALIIQLILAIIIVIPTEFIGAWYIENKMVLPVDRIASAKLLFHVSLATFVFNIFQVPFIAAVMAHEKMGFYSLISSLQAILSVVIVYVISIMPYDNLVSYGLLLLFVSFLLFVLYIIFCRINFDEIYLSNSANLKLFKEMLSFSGWNIFGTMGAMFKDQGLNILLNLFYGPIVNASRGIAVQVNNGLQSFVANISVPVRPQLIQSYSKGDVHRALNLTYKISKFSCFVLMVMSIPIILEIDIILKIWLGDNIPEYASVFVVIIVVNSFLANLNAAMSGIVHASGKMSFYQLSGFIVSLVTVVICYIFLRQSENPSIALIIVLAMDIIRQVIAVIIVKHIENSFSYFTYITKVIMPLCLVIIPSFLLPLCIKNAMTESVLRLIVVFVTSVTFSILCIFLIGLDKQERNFLRKILIKGDS